MEQTAEDRYFAVRDAAIDRFTPERVPNIGQAELDAEGKARAELDRLIRAVLGSQSPEGFDAGQFNLTTLFSGDIDFGKLDGLVFEADGGDTRMVLSTRSMLMNWLQAKWQDPNDRLSPDVAMKSETFYLRAIGSDAAILRYADIWFESGDAFAILAARTQDAPPFEADEVFVTAIRGDRVFVASARIEPPLAIAACTKPREEAEAKLAELERAEIRPGPRNAAAGTGNQAARPDRSRFPGLFRRARTESGGLPKRHEERHRTAGSHAGKIGSVAWRALSIGQKSGNVCNGVEPCLRIARAQRSRIGIAPGHAAEGDTGRVRGVHIAHLVADGDGLRRPGAGSLQHPSEFRSLAEEGRSAGEI